MSMDSNGVPQKINRHVFKAVTHYTLSRKSGVKFKDILDYVRCCNRNLKPVRNLKFSVRKALDNFQRVGLIQKDKNFRYKIIDILKSSLSNVKSDVNDIDNASGPSNDPSYQNVTKQKNNAPPRLPKTEGDIGPDSKKRKKNDHSVNETSPESARKRFKSQKNSHDRVGKKANLPKTRRTHVDSYNCATADCSNYSQNIFSENGSTLSEPGADDRDSGDEDLCKKSSEDEEVPKDSNNKTDDHFENENDANENRNSQNPESSTNTARKGVFFPYLN